MVEEFLIKQSYPIKLEQTFYEHMLTEIWFLNLSHYLTPWCVLKQESENPD